MMLSLRLTQSPQLAFDSYLVFQNTAHLLKLLVTYLLFFLPFFCGACFIGLSFRVHSRKIGKLYFFNLTGSALGGLLIIPLLHYLKVPQAVALVAMLPVIASLLSLSLSKRHIIQLVFIGISILFLVYSYIKPPSLFLSEYKSLSKVLNMPQTDITAERTTPYGLLQAVSSPYLRYAPGLSFRYIEEIPFETVIFNNGDFIGPLFPLEQQQDNHYYDYSTMALPFIINKKENVLILDSGSGDMVSYALYREIEQIVAVDGNPALFDFIKTDLASIQSSYLHPNVSMVAQDSYSFLLSDKGSYDLIILPLTDAFGGSAGIYAFSEKYLLTLNAFQQMWDKLPDQGMISISTWIDFPLRYPIKTLATLTELLENNGIKYPGQHLAAIRNWSMITFVLKKNPLSDDEIAAVRDFSQKMDFDLLLLPGLHPDERMKHHILTDESLFIMSDRILDSKREQLYRDYHFNIAPAVEDKPYYFQFLKLSMIPELLKDFDARTLPFLELGYLLVLLTFVQIIILTALFIILPLAVKKWKAPGKLWTFSHFCFIGLGYMMLEIVLIQRFIFYLGTPLYSTAAVICSILLFSGIGSYLSSHIKGTVKNLIVIFLLIIVLIILYAGLLTSVLHNTLNLSVMLRLLFTILCLAPLSLLLGFPFPIGIKILDSETTKDNISWAWSINGSFSVVSTVLATIIAVEAGFLIVMLLAAACYLCALLSNLFFRFTR